YPVRFYSKGQISPGLDSVAFTAAAGTVIGPVLNDNTYEIAKVIQVKTSPDSVNASHILLNPVAEGGVDKAQVKADSIVNLLQGGASFTALAVEFSADPGSKDNGGELGTITRGMIEELDEVLFDGQTGDVKVVTTNYGVHIVKVNRQIGRSPIAKLAILDRAIHPSKETTDAAYSKANEFFSAVTTGDFDQIAKQQNVTILKNERTTAMDNMFSGVEVPRDLIRWAFQADKGQLGERIYESDNHFIVARLAEVQPKGIQSLESVKPLIEPVVKNLVKARMLKEKMNNAINGSSSIDQIGEKLQKNVQSVENVALANPVIPGVAMEGRVVGTLFGLQPNKPSDAIEGKQGVYAVQVVGFSNPSALAGEELQNQQKQLTSTKAQRSWSVILKALQD